MDQANGATPDELQQAINSITNGGAAADGADPVAEVTNKLAGDAAILPPAPAPEIPETPAAPVADANGTIDGIPIEPKKALYGDPDLDRVKTGALSDLRPILEKIDIAPEKKFIIYKDIIELYEDKACIEPAYKVARAIKDEKLRGEALVYIVECIDKLGIQMSVEDNQQ